MLKVYFNGTDKSVEMENYLIDTHTFTLVSGQYIEVGYKKPINAVFLGASTLNTNSSVLSVEYYNGTAFTDVSGLVDRSRGLSKQSHIKWDRNQTDEASTTLNAQDLYWYRISVDADTSAMVFTGINLLFSDLDSMEGSEPNINSSNFYAENRDDHIGFVQDAKDEIIQRLRNQGKRIEASNGDLLDLNAFDINDYTQLAEASKYLSLSKIFFYLSDAIDDKYNQKGQDYRRKFDEMFKLYSLSIDVDDDGIEDQDEKNNFQVGFIRSV
jgi:hypothetical protein